MVKQNPWNENSLATSSSHIYMPTFLGNENWALGNIFVHLEANMYDVKEDSCYVH